LWEEYRDAHTDDRPYTYVWFCEGYREWKKRSHLVMRQTHKLGEKTFVDWAGSKVPIVDPKTGEVTEASVFLATLGVSSYTYAEAFVNQKMPAWIAGHCNAFRHFGGTTEIVVPDNPKTGVTKADHYDPDLNLTYQDWAEYYVVVVIPARPRKPKDKAKVESAVRVTGEWILARLRNVTFFSLSELNAAIWALLEELNGRPFQKRPGSRRECYEEQEKATLRPLPAEPYEICEWMKARVAPDYHVEVEGHYYSVPFILVKEIVEIRVSSMIVRAFHRNRLITSHVRSSYRGQHTTKPEHMPPHHRHNVEWTPARFQGWAQQSGAFVLEFVDELMNRRQHPEQAYRSCFGLLKLGQQFGSDRLDRACRRAISLGAYRYKNVKNILEKSLDKQPMPKAISAPKSAGNHENVRGPQYYSDPELFSDN